MNQVDENGNTSTTVHFVYMKKTGEVMPTFMRGAVVMEPEGVNNPMWHIACMPEMKEFHQTRHHPNHQRSDDPRAVTCQKCKETDAYKNQANVNK